MLSLTGAPLLVLATALALAAPFAVAWWWRRLDGSAIVVLGGRFAVVATAQVVAIAAVFLWVNHTYTFYSSWDDLFGVTQQNAGIAVNETAAPDGSRTMVLPIAGPAAGVARHALVWLPKQYDEPAYAHTRFPVVVFLPGQPSTPGTTYQRFGFGQVASQAIASGKVAPFVAVIPPLMTDPPRDTECTNVPNGPQAETYLGHDLVQSVAQQLRVDPPGRDWTAAGWSTGAFCAAKLALSQRGHWGSVIALGGYFRPETDRSTGNLFHGDRNLERHNSPMWLYEHNGTSGLRMLLIAGRQDAEAWHPTLEMLRATSGNPDVNYIAFPSGGHNYRNYDSYLGRALAWAEPANAT
jgi:S-formylglutathione hydrolase FrmB